MVSNMHKRKTKNVVIVANGPSLNRTPLLELSKNFDMIAMNRINLIYDRTEWRPDFYFMVDMNMQNTPGYYFDSIMAHYDTPKYLWDAMRDGTAQFPGVGDIPKTVWIPRCQKHHYYMYNNVDKRVKHWHLPEICTGIGGLSAMMQIAVLMGYEAIYLVGCDLGYKADGKANHFDPEYTQDSRDRAKFDNEAMIYLHEMAKRNSPIPIYNATSGGNLEVHKRVAVRDLI